MTFLQHTRARTRTSLAAGALSGLLLLTACGGGADSAAVDTEALDIAWAIQPPTMDPLMTTAMATRDIGRNVWEPLIAQDADGEIQPVLAESFSVSEDGTVISFVLREGVTFHNGEPMTAEDVVASIERWIAKTTNGQQYFADAKVAKADDRTVTMTLPQPMFTALDMLADATQIMAIQPASVLENAPTEGVEEFVGTGPYVFEEWATDQHVHLSKYADYVSPEGETSGTAGKKDPVFENIYFHFVSDPSTRMSGIQTGEYDAAAAMNFDMAEQLESDPTITLNTGDEGFNGMVFNKKQGLMTDVNMRQAVLSALDLGAIQQAAYVNEEYYTTNGALMREDQTPYYTEAGIEHHNNPDPARVKELLDAAGYKGEEIRILTTRDYEDQYNNLVVAEQQLKEAGINAKLYIYDWPTVLTMREDPNAYEIFVTSFSNSAMPNSYVFLTKTWPGWTDDPALTAGLDAVTYATDEAEAAKASEQLQTAFYEYLPMVKFGTKDTLTALSSDLTGYEYVPTQGDVFYNVRPAEA